MTLGEYLDPAIGQVPGPSHQAQRPGYLTAGLAVTDLLHLP
jgi:hypothetical protein